MLIVELRQIAIEPCQQMHAVGYRGDGNFPYRQLGPQLLPHFLRHLAVQTAHRVAERGGLNGRDRHGERFVVISGRKRPKARNFSNGMPLSRQYSLKY